MMNARAAMQLAPGGGPEHIFVDAHDVFQKKDREFAGRQCRGYGGPGAWGLCAAMLMFVLVYQRTQ
jgi:hypothetical protein